MSDSIPPNDPQQLGPWLRRFEHPAGLRWVARDGALRIDRQPALDDQGAAALPTTAGEHRLALRYLKELLQAARQQDNQLRGGPFDKLSSATDEAVALLDGPTEGLLERLPELLASTQDVVSFIDLDERQGAGERLEPELKRLLTRASAQLVVLATGFPYVNARLSALQEFRSAIDLAAARQEHRALAEAELLEPEDARLLEQQARVSAREGVQGERAGKGQFFTLRNFMLVALSWTALEVGKNFITGVMEKSERVQAAQLWVARRIVDEGLDSAGRLLAGLPDGIASLLRGMSRDIVVGKPPLAAAPSPRRPEEAMEPPPGFDMGEVKRMILAGVAPPAEWVPFITALDFDGEKDLRDLAPLAGLTALQSLDLMNTQVSDIAPLAALTALQSLGLINTNVSTVAPLAGLTALQTLHLDGTQVSDVAPLAALTALRSLGLMNTQVSDVGRLAGLTALKSLDLMDTQVSDVAPLAGLTALQSFDLTGTQVSDVAPLAGLTALQSLGLAGTQVSDVAPLAGLIALESLDLRRTQVSDVAPLAGLTAMQGLYLRNTQVSDVAPLAGLTVLQNLDLGGTQVSDVAPLAALSALQDLNLGSTQVSDVGPLAGLTALQHLDLRDTQVSDVAPLAALTALQHLDLRNTQVSDVAPLAGLAALQSLDLSNTQVSDVEPLAALSALQSLELSNTQVSDVAPLAALSALRILDLTNTRLSDIEPLAAVNTLRRLGLARTTVNDVMHLAGVTALGISLDLNVSIWELAPKLLTVREAQAILDRRHKPH